LVTGATGQDGSYLCEQLLAGGLEVFGLVRSPSAALPAGVVRLVGDLRDAASLRRAVEEARPDEVYNLAAETFVPASFGAAERTEDVNAAGLERLAKALLDCGFSPRLCQASSAEIFGPPDGRPQGEDHALLASSPYGKAKLRAHRFVATLRERHGLFACSAILFNHESPRRSPSFVTRKITMAVARIAHGSRETLVLGNLDAARDWGYAPEYTEAMQRMLRADQPRDYVVATGRAIRVRDFLELAFGRAGLDWQQHVTVDEALGRGGDEAARIGDPSRIAAELGWRARTRVEELAALMVDADLAAGGS
jgi:GDPmannose 4,6-dehydratase